MVLDGPMNRAAFQASFEQVLVPTLHSGDMVILDNLSAHKRADVRRAVEAAGATLRYLPPYLPDFDPIEYPSPSSRPLCEGQRHGPSTACGIQSWMRSRPSRQPSAQITSPPQGISRNKRSPL
jgi:hypothetical protein